jgi:hypothetical protein
MREMIVFFINHESTNANPFLSLSSFVFLFINDFQVFFEKNRKFSFFDTSSPQQQTVTTAASGIFTVIIAIATAHLSACLTPLLFQLQLCTLYAIIE